MKTETVARLKLILGAIDEGTKERDGFLHEAYTYCYEFRELVKAARRLLEEEETMRYVVECSACRFHYLSNVFGSEIEKDEALREAGRISRDHEDTTGHKGPFVWLSLGGIVTEDARQESSR